jgi:hypothetical protein
MWARASSLVRDLRVHGLVSLQHERDARAHISQKLDDVGLKSGGLTLTQLAV